VARGEVRFFLVSPQAEQLGVVDSQENDLAGWVRDNCEPVPSKLWQSKSSEPLKASEARSGGLMIQTEGTGEALYDCGGRKQ
jgi:hypothetical protein